MEVEEDRTNSNCGEVIPLTVATIEEDLKLITESNLTQKNCDERSPALIDEADKSNLVTKQHTIAKNCDIKSLQADQDVNPVTGGKSSVNNRGKVTPLPVAAADEVLLVNTFCNNFDIVVTRIDEELITKNKTIENNSGGIKLQPAASDTSADSEVESQKTVNLKEDDYSSLKPADSDTSANSEVESQMTVNLTEDDYSSLKTLCVHLIRICPESYLHGYNKWNTLAPFACGFKRELVHRKNAGKSSSDVYYFAPDGKKLRSSKDVERYLSAHPFPLQVSNFSFKKKLISTNNIFEIQREAGEPGINTSKILKTASHAIPKASCHISGSKSKIPLTVSHVVPKNMASNKHRRSTESKKATPTERKQANDCAVTTKKDMKKCKKVKTDGSVEANHDISGNKSKIPLTVSHVMPKNMASNKQRRSTESKKATPTERKESNDCTVTTNKDMKKCKKVETDGSVEASHISGSKSEIPLKISHVIPKSMASNKYRRSTELKKATPTKRKQVNDCAVTTNKDMKKCKKVPGMVKPYVHPIGLAMHRLVQQKRAKKLMNKPNKLT